MGREGVEPTEIHAGFETTAPHRNSACGPLEYAVLWILCAAWTSRKATKEITVSAVSRTPSQGSQASRTPDRKREEAEVESDGCQNPGKNSGSLRIWSGRGKTSVLRPGGEARPTEASAKRRNP
jgi:hypothetical protein